MRIVKPKRFPPLVIHVIAYLLCMGLGITCIVLMGRQTVVIAVGCVLVLAGWSLLLFREVAIAIYGRHLRCRIERVEYDRESEVLMLQCVIYSVKQEWIAEDIEVAEAVLNNSFTMGMPSRLAGVSKELVHGRGCSSVVLRAPLELPHKECAPALYTGIIFLKVRGRKPGGALSVVCMFPVVKTSRAEVEILGREAMGEEGPKLAAAGPSEVVRHE